jgi:hypothetical protein
MRVSINATLARLTPITGASMNKFCSIAGKQLKNLLLLFGISILPYFRCRTITSTAVCYKNSVCIYLTALLCISKKSNLELEIDFNKSKLY